MRKLCKIFSKAPTRIDLAGGTVDIWPLFLFLDKPITINASINLFAETELQERKASTPQSSGVYFLSEDQNFKQFVPWNELKSFSSPPALSLHSRLLNYFLSEISINELESLELHFTTRAKSPAGAGLGGSSALSVSMIGALSHWAAFIKNPTQNPQIDIEKNGTAFIEVVRDIETQVIKVPAGLQDYYGALYGGIQKISWNIHQHHQSRFSEQLLPSLTERILLFYSGHSRNSGINNWALYKGFIDESEAIRDSFKRIVKSTHSLAAALEKSDFNQIADAIESEWIVRQRLAPGISTPEITQAFNEASRLGIRSGKICGAGGGGCFFLFLNDSQLSKKGEVIQKIESISGIRSLPFQLTPKGVNVECSLSS